MQILVNGKMLASTHNALDKAALCYVARVRREDAVKVLFSDGGIRVNFRDGGYKTPSRLAVSQDIKLLCDFCCTMKGGGQCLGLFGPTALHLAACQPDGAILQLLPNRGDVDLAKAVIHLSKRSPKVREIVPSNVSAAS